MALMLPSQLRFAIEGPKHYDVVISHSPHQDGQHVCKRIIGLVSRYAGSSHTTRSHMPPLFPSIPQSGDVVHLAGGQGMTVRLHPPSILAPKRTSLTPNPRSFSSGSQGPCVAGRRQRRQLDRLPVLRACASSLDPRQSRCSSMAATQDDLDRKQASPGSSPAQDAWQRQKEEQGRHRQAVCTHRNKAPRTCTPQVVWLITITTCCHQYSTSKTVVFFLSTNNAVVNNTVNNTTTTIIIIHLSHPNLNLLSSSQLWCACVHS